MRGSPLLRALLAFIGIALVGLPLWRLTHQTAAVVAAPTPEVKAQEDRIRAELERQQK